MMHPRMTDANISTIRAMAMLEIAKEEEAEVYRIRAYVN
jgi:hypothetical protein